MNKWMKYITVALMSIALTFTMIPLEEGGVYADFAEDADGVPAAEAECDSVPADRYITPDMIAGGQSEMKNAKAGLKKSVNTESNIPILVVVIGFNNMEYVNEYDWGKLLYDPSNSRNMLEYYKDMSGGRFTFEPVSENSEYDISSGDRLKRNTNKYDKKDDGIVHVKLDMDHYQWKSRDADNAKNAKEMIRAFVLAANKAMNYMNDDFVSLDKDNDGVLREEELALVFIVAGYDSATKEAYRKQSENLYMGGHRWTIGEGLESFEIPESELTYPSITRTYQGSEKTVRMDPYVAISEQCERSDEIINGRVSSLAHELGHHLGLPDLYSTGTDAAEKPWSGYVSNRMSLMSTSWTTDENGIYIPASLDPWSKMKLGWITPQEMTEGEYTATGQKYPALSENNILKVPAASIDPDRASGEEEYYLIENRRTEKWDWSLSVLNPDNWATGDGNGGLVFWHIDEKVLEHYKQSGRYMRVNTPDHRPGVMPLYLENDYTTWISDGTTVGTDVPFFDKYNLENNRDKLKSQDATVIDLPKYGSEELTGRPENRTYSGANVRILSDSGSAMKVMFWDSSHSHIYNKWNIIKEATCTENGLKEATCTVCGAEETRVIPADHKWAKKYTVDKAATYAARGLKSIHCLVCDKIKKGSSVVIPKFKVPATKILRLTAAKKAFRAKWKRGRNITGYELQYAVKRNFKSGKKTVKIKKAGVTSKKIKKLKAKKKYFVRIRAYKTVKGKKYYSVWSKKRAVRTK